MSLTVVRKATPGPHAATHQSAGRDEISVAGLLGLLGTEQDPAAHKTSHQNGGSDEVSIASLVGEAAELAAHKVLDTGVHGSGSSYLAYFGQQGIDVNRVVWKAAFIKVYDYDSNDPAHDWTTLDVTASTSSVAKMVLLQQRFQCLSFGDSGGNYFGIRTISGPSIQYVSAVLYDSYLKQTESGNVLVELQSGETFVHTVIEGSGASGFAVDLDVFGYIE